MVKVRKENVVLKVSENEVENYINEGYSIVVKKEKKANKQGNKVKAPGIKAPKTEKTEEEKTEEEKTEEEKTEEEKSETEKSETEKSKN